MTRRGSSARLRVAILGLSLLGLNLIALGVFTWPRLTRVRRAEDRAVEVAARRAALEELWARVTTRKETVARNRADIESLSRDHLKFRSDDLFAAQREIEKLAKEAGLQPKRSTYEIEKLKDTDLVRCQVSIPLDGTYTGLSGFLARVESAKRFIVVDQMSLSEDQAGARMSLKLSVIFKDGEPRASR